MTEGTGAAFTVTASEAPGAALTVNLEVADAPNADFVSDSNQGDGTVIIAAGKASAEFTVPTEAGADDEPNGRVTVTVAEGTARAFTLSLGRALRAGEKLAIPLAFAGGATRGTDYTTPCPGALPAGVGCANLDSGNAAVTFTGSAGASATSVALRLTPLADNVTEPGGEDGGRQPRRAGGDGRRLRPVHHQR